MDLMRIKLHRNSCHRYNIHYGLLKMSSLDMYLNEILKALDWQWLPHVSVCSTKTKRGLLQHLNCFFTVYFEIPFFVRRLLTRLWPWIIRHTLYNDGYISLQIGVVSGQNDLDDIFTCLREGNSRKLRKLHWRGYFSF